MNLQSRIQPPRGELSLQVLRKPPFTVVPPKELSLGQVLKFATPGRHKHPEVNRFHISNFPNIWRGFKKVALAKSLGLCHIYGQLSLVKIFANGQWLDFELASLRVVTDAGVGYIVDAFQNSVELEDMKYHGIGTGGTAEAACDTDLVTELTTQYSTDNTRATGTTTEGASANIYRTVGTNQVDAGVAIVEHGVLSNATVGSGVLLDRSVFSTVNLSSGESLQSTYDLTFPSGS